jgi:thiamine-phosphate pyrophosphorylase
MVGRRGVAGGARVSGAKAGPSAEVRRALRLIVITDARLAAPRTVVDVVGAALSAGARAIQLRDKSATARELHAAALELLVLTRRHGALLFVNDRVDVAMAVGADGAHLGPDDLPVAAARRWVPADFVLGYSTDDPSRARIAEADGADYLGCGAVYGTSSKEVGGEMIGPGRVDEVARAVAIPVVAIGGITPERAPELARTRAAGVAVIGAVMAAEDPGAAVEALLRPFRAREEDG